MAAPANFFTSSPTVVMQPSHPDQYFVNSHYGNPNSAGHIASTVSNVSTPNGSIPPTPGSLAGRKRSRADIFADDEDDHDLEDGSIATPINEELPKPRGKPIYGPGMTLIYPEDPGYEAAAESQSGTWVEANEERAAFRLSHMKRPSVSSRKSLRKDPTTSGSDHLAQLVLPPQMREVTAEPLIDEATRLLGISWTRLDSSEALRISQSAYSKWIQNHYPSLNNVAVWMENSAIPGYLVAANNAYTGQQAYYIFSQDLTEARLVTSEPMQLVPRLKMLPALHLAAPGGHIRAETDPITASPSNANTSHAEMTNFSKDLSRLRDAMTDGVAESHEHNGICAAHEMEMD